MTTATEVRIVPATREHIPFVAWVVMTATRSHLPRSLWEFSLGTDDDATILRYLEAFADTDAVHWAHYSTFLIAEVDGVPAAGLCGFFENELTVQSMIFGGMEANAKIGRTAEEAAEGWKRASSIAAITIPHEPGMLGRRARRHPPGLPPPRPRRRLVREMLQRGRERGAKTAEIGVLIGNDRAQKAYEKCGFEVFAEARDAEFERVYGCPGAVAMRRAI